MPEVDDDRAREALPGGIEETLTDGYAHALGLDRECRRIVHRIASLAAAGDVPPSSPELWSLAERLAEAQAELSRLRHKLDELRRRVDPRGVRY
jgi:hypothetical protein